MDGACQARLDIERQLLSIEPLHLSSPYILSAQHRKDVWRRVFSEKDIPSLNGKVILITGGNAGLEKETILQLAKHSPKEIFLAARTQSKAEAAIGEVKANSPDIKVSFIQLDLTSFASVKRAAGEFQTRCDRLDILIDNAVRTNHLGHAMFTKLLLPTLLKTADEPDSDVRVINVTSEAHKFAPGIIYDQDGLEQYMTVRRYGQSKLANILRARELRRCYPSITATSVHPGIITTELYAPAKKSNFLLPFFLLLIRPITSNVPQGAHNQLWAATADKEKVRNSWYWTTVSVKSDRSFWQAQKSSLAKELWDWTEKQLEEYLRCTGST